MHKSTKIKTIKHLHCLDRPREKIIRYGAQHLSDLELMTAILGSGTKDCQVRALASLVLKSLNTNSNKPDFQQLKAIKGMGVAKCCQILAAWELVIRRVQNQHTYINSPEDLLPLIGYIRIKSSEHLLCITLDGSRRVIDNRLIGIGILDSMNFHPREIFIDAINDRAAAIALAHNHPTDCAKPSKADILATKRIENAGEMLGIKLLDHIIVSRTASYSFLENKLLKSH